MQRQVVYFEQGGPDNTETTLKLVREQADALGIRKVVVATSTGATALRTAETLRGKQVIAVVRPPREGKEAERLDPKAAAHLRDLGCALVTPQEEHPDVRNLRAFGTGCKVACEIAVRATQAGAISPDEEVISIAGSNRGADTALVLQGGDEVRRVRVRELICKPR